ncbi:MAG: CvpA family protein [bacterium]
MITIDFMILATLAALFYFNARKGLIYGVFSLVSYSLGIWVASKYFSQTQYLFVSLFSSPDVRNVVSFIQLFLITLLAVRLTGKILRKAVKITGLGIMDSIGGGILGVAKGIILISAALLIYMSLHPDSGKMMMARSVVAEHFLPVMEFIHRQMPSYLNDHIEKDLSVIRDWEKLIKAGFTNLSKLTDQEVSDLLKTVDNEEIKKTIGKHFR